MVTKIINFREYQVLPSSRAVLGSLLLIGLLTLVLGCGSPLENERIDEFALESGGYMRVVSPYPITASSFSFSQANMAGTRLECVHEAVTMQSGTLFESYQLMISFVDNTPANGVNNVASTAFRTISASSYAIDPVTGYPRAMMVITGAEAMEAAGLDLARVAAGDRFEVSGTMLLTDGTSYSAANTTIDITGGAFYSSPFFYRIAIAP